MTTPRLILTQTCSKGEAAADISLDGQPPSDVWSTLSTALLSEIAAGVQSAVADSDASPPRAVKKALSTAEMTEEEECVTASIVSSWCAGINDERRWQAGTYLTSLGSGKRLTGGARGDIGAACGVAQLVESEQPIIIRFSEAFKKQRADQRRDICKLIAHLSTAVDVYLVPTTLRLERWIAHAHGDDLPGSLIEQCNTGQGTDSPKSEVVDEAIDRFDVDDGIIELLRSVAAATTETRRLDELEVELGVQRDTIHNRLHHLREYDLISDTLFTDDGAAVSLTSTGRAYLDAVYEFSGVQSTFEESLIATGKSSQNMPCNPACSREGGEGAGWSRNRLPRLHKFRQIPRHRFLATGAVTTDADISVVDTDVTPLDDRAAPGLHYDHDDRRLLVSAEYDNPMQYMVSIARALSTEQVWSWILTEDKLDIAECDRFRGLFDEHRTILRQLRCIGYLPDDVTTIDEFRENILDARDELLELTKRLTQGDYPNKQDRADFRSRITSIAHGLAGVMAHLLDLVNVDMIREVRIPRYRKFAPEKQAALVQTIGTISTIQSRHGDATTHRQLYEHREGKREQAIEVDPDAHNLYSKLIGSIAIVGDFKTQKEGFVQSLEDGLEPRQPHDDAPEFQLNLSIKGELSRSEYAQTVTALCKKKNLSPTPQAVSTLAGICNSPYEVAEALNRLQPNDDRRPIDAREVRFALSHLGADDILRGTSSTPRKVVMALLDATEPLSQSELSDEADVSTRSLRDHLPDLIDLGLIDETPTGYRFNLSFNTADERTDDRYPMYVVDPDLRPDIHKAAKALKVAHEHHFRTPIPDDEFPTSPTGSNWCVDLRGLGDPDPWVRDVIPLLWGLETREEYRDDTDLNPLIGGGDTNEIRLGPEIPQLRLTAY